MVINGFGNSFGGVMTLTRKRYSGDIAVVLSVLLIAWIVNQVIYRVTLAATIVFWLRSR